MLHADISESGHEVPHPREAGTKGVGGYQPDALLQAADLLRRHLQPSSRQHHSAHHLHRELILNVISLELLAAAHFVIDMLPSAFGLLTSASICRPNTPHARGRTVRRNAACTTDMSTSSFSLATRVNVETTCSVAHLDSGGCGGCDESSPYLWPQRIPAAERVVPLQYLHERLCKSETHSAADELTTFRPSLPAAKRSTKSSTCCEAPPQAESATIRATELTPCRHVGKDNAPPRADRCYKARASARQPYAPA